MIRQITELTLRKKEFMAKVLRLTGQQRECLEPSQMEALFSIIEDKQGCINEINKIDAEILLLEKGLPEEKGLDWNEVDSLREDISKLVGQAQKIDNNNLEQIRFQAQKLKLDFDVLQARKTMFQAYYKKNLKRADSFFIDNKK